MRFGQMSTQIQYFQIYFGCVNDFVDCDSDIVQLGTFRRDLIDILYQAFLSLSAAVNVHLTHIAHAKISARLYLALLK